MMLRGCLRLGLMLLAGLLASCSSFDARWKAASASGTAERWDGRWTSEGHQTAGGGAEGGRLRAVTETAPGQAITAHFHANWLFLASDYTMTLTPKSGASRRDKGREFAGTHTLPKAFGGTYRYEASLVGDRLTARYTSSYDHGIFALTRVGPSKEITPDHSRH